MTSGAVTASSTQPWPPAALASTHGVLLPFVAEMLRDTFDREFEFWADGPDWQRVVACSLCSGSSCDRQRERDTESQQCAVRACRQTASSKAPCTLSRDHNQYVLAIPIQQHGHLQFVALQEFETNSPHLLLQLAHAFLRQLSQADLRRKLELENACFVRQVSQDLEELMLLRSIAEHLETTELDDNQSEFCHSTLVLLNEQVRGECLCLFGNCSATEDISDLNAMVSWAGTDARNRILCRKLIVTYREAARNGAVVRNTIHKSADAPLLPGIRNFVLVPVSRDERCLAWLLAVNRVVPDRADDTFGWQVGEREFGTQQASLMTAAASFIAMQLHNMRLYREKEQWAMEVVHALASAIDAKDPYTRGHSDRVAIYARMLAASAGYDPQACDRIYLAALLHDVGKIGTRGAVLRKTDRLTPEEFREIQKHPDEAWSILSVVSRLEHIIPGVLHHHERFDGGGYPDGLAGEAIPRDARILAVADAYDAMTSDRPYRQGMSHEKALSVLREGAGTQWDPEIVAVMLRIEEQMRAAGQSDPTFRPRREHRNGSKSAR